MAENYLELYQKALTGLKTGGKTLEASLQEIEEGKKQAIAGGQQALVSGGLSGTTMAAGVPIQAEKIAARQRLGARGQAEQTYLTTLASFAAFSQRGIEAQKQRDFEAEQAELARDASFTYSSRVNYPSSGDGGGGGISGGGGGGYSSQFPSIYDQGGTQVPDWSGGGASATVSFGPSPQPTSGYGLADNVDALKVERGPGGVYVLGDRTYYTKEESAWLRQQLEKIAAAKKDDLGAISDPGSAASKYTLGGYGGGF